jgi:predicted DNA-binding transcriptional regulator AlpA
MIPAMNRAELAALIRTAVREELAGLVAAPRAEGFLTMSAAAKRLGINRVTMWRWLADGIVPRKAITKVGAHHRIAAWWVQGHSA